MSRTRRTTSSTTWTGSSSPEGRGLDRRKRVNFGTHGIGKRIDLDRKDSQAIARVRRYKCREGLHPGDVRDRPSSRSTSGATSSIGGRCRRVVLRMRPDPRSWQLSREIRLIRLLTTRCRKDRDGRTGEFHPLRSPPYFPFVGHVARGCGPGSFTRMRVRQSRTLRVRKHASASSCIPRRIGEAHRPLQGNGELVDLVRLGDDTREPEGRRLDHGRIPCVAA